MFESGALSPGRKFDDPVNLALPVSWQILGWFLFGSLAFVILYLSIAQYSKVEIATGLVAPAAGMANITSSITGTVETVYAREGARVSKNDPIIRINADANLTSGGTSRHDQLQTSIANQSQLAQSQFQIARASVSAQRAQATADIDGLRNKITSVRHQIVLQTELVDKGRETVTMRRKLAEQGYLSLQAVRESEENWILRQQQLAGLQASLIDYEAQLRKAGKDLSDLDRQESSNRIQLELSQSELKERQADLDAQAGTIIRSPIDGAISAMLVQPGQSVLPSQAIVDVAPNSNDLIGVVYVSSAAIGNIDVGQEVKIELDAFPYAKYGFITGKIFQVSESPTTKALPDGAIKSVYIVKVSLPSSSIPALKIKRPLRPGMAFNARIIVARQSLIEWLFDPLIAVGKR